MTERAWFDRSRIVAIRKWMREQFEIVLDRGILILIVSRFIFVIAADLKSSSLEAFVFLKASFTPVEMFVISQRNTRKRRSDDTTGGSARKSNKSAAKSLEKPAARPHAVLSPGTQSQSLSTILSLSDGIATRSKSTSSAPSSSSIRGVRNYGNTCYVASALQVAHSVSLWSSVSS